MLPGWERLPLTLCLRARRLRPMALKIRSCAALATVLLAACHARPVAAPPTPQPDHEAATGSAARVPAATSTVAPSAAPAPSAVLSTTAVGSSTPDEPPLPAGFVRLAPESETKCGDLRVEFLTEPKGSDERFVRVHGPDGRRVYEAHGRRYTIDVVSMVMDLSGEFCGDLTGDGVPEIVLTERTMGAHCCYTHYAVSMTSPPKRLLMWEKGDAGTPILPAKLRPGRDWQLTGLVVMWPPFDTNKGEPALVYPLAPLVPVVFSLEGGEYHMTSLSFPDVYRKDREAARAACQKDPKACDGQLNAWIDSLAIGDWDTEKKAPYYDQLRTQLERPRADMKKMMLRVLGSEQRPAPTTPPR